ncbi:acetate kinase [Marinactinospora thermotolerans DSM 45154]|uniref:Acetate kinase n=1 Tax=Marinactinospora thermotolerans DSM 45154 TaxID=1122192 RepID=A0A1T4NDF5_9ACTN|nr:acetate/propionate family kinase [Marinactinospora thermotolerans]SJZ77371.1 acetate kinase [Marinactinospora thermotolerans DSM 45154]
MPTSSAILTVNAGSSSLQLHLVAGQEIVATAHEERVPDRERVEGMLAEILDGREERVTGVAHRLVHGGAHIRTPLIADDAAVEQVRAIVDVDPLHLEPALAVLAAARRRLPDVPHVLCPDTAFHADLPEPAAVYPLPQEWRREYGLRRYGFHGLSYAWALGRAAELLGRRAGELRLVLAHLGGGASVCAVDRGRSVDTSMGFTPLEGLPMSKRSGSVDPGMLLWLLEGSRLTVEQLREGLYHRSGLLGLSAGRSGDTRDLVRAAETGDADARLALEVFARGAAREIAAVATALDGLDAIVFTGEIGWDQPEVREAVCARLGVLGVSIPQRADVAEDGLVSAPGAAVPVLVVRPREELQLARDALGALGEAPAP